MTNTPHEENQELIERGRMASAAAGMIADFVIEEKEKAVAMLVSLYRNGSLTHDMAIGIIGGLAAIDHLMSTLEYTESQGIVASNKEYGNDR